MQIKKQLFALFLNLGLALILLATENTATGQSVAYWNPTGQTAFGVSPFTPTTADPNATVTGIVRGSGLTTSGTAATSAWGANGWQDNQATDDFMWTMTANNGYELSLTSLSFCYRRSSTGPNLMTFEYALNGGSYITITSVSCTSTATTGVLMPLIDLSTISDLQNVPNGTIINMRISGSGATSSAGTFYAVPGSGSTGITVNGTVSVASTTCNAPINPAASNITDLTADVSWDAQTGAAGYEYVVDMNAADPLGAGTPTTNLTESVSGLTPVTMYYLHVRTDCGSGNFSPWSTISFTTLVTPCDAPINLVAANITDLAVDVSWDAQTGATVYEYVVDINSNDPTGVGTTTSNLTESISGLNAATTYYLHVRTNCGSGNFSLWSTISFTTLVTPCDAPVNLAVSTITAVSVTISWDAQTGATGYEYVVDMNAGDPAGTGTSTTNLTESITGLTPSTNYYLHARTNCGGANISPWATVPFSTDSDLGVNAGPEIYFSVYPNPVNTMLTVSFAKTSEKTKITILNLVGQTVYTENAGENTTMDVSFLTAGIYYIRFEQGDVIHTQKIIKK